MPAGLQFGYGFRRLFDANQRYMRPAGPVYLRMRNFADPQMQPWAQYGFAISPSGSSSVGTTDTLIDPPPSWKTVSMHNIGMSNGKLRFGAKEFLISHTFVKQQMSLQNVSDATLIWRGPKVVGLVENGLVCSIEQYVPDMLAGDVISWIITANVGEIR